MVACEFLERCPVFAEFRLEGTENFWIQLYCLVPRKDDCTRGRVQLVGEPAPPMLLPNGQILYWAAAA